jgi:hypothetical protein
VKTAMRQLTGIWDYNSFLTPLFSTVLYLTGCTYWPAKVTTGEVPRGTRTVFYTESVAGQVSTCGIAFKGVDFAWNFFEGAYGFRYSENKELVPFFKLRSLPSSQDESRKTKEINRAWIRSAKNTTVDGDWIRVEEPDSFMIIGKNTGQGAGLYFDLIGGESISVGFSHERGSSYRIYELGKFPASQEAAASSCMARMRSQSLDQ